MLMRRDHRNNAPTTTAVVLHHAGALNNRGIKYPMGGLLKHATPAACAKCIGVPQVKNYKGIKCIEMLK